jgi:hypothetical protein
MPAVSQELVTCRVYVWSLNYQNILATPARTSKPTCPYFPLLSQADLLHVVPILVDHPRQPTRRNQRRKEKRQTHPRRPKHPPLTHEMPPRNDIAPHRELVHPLVVHIVCRVQPYYARDESPGSECSCGERGCRTACQVVATGQELRWGGRGARGLGGTAVDALRVESCCVGLEGVSDGDYGELGGG